MDTLVERLNFKTLIIPHWFGVDVEQWTSLQSVLGEFYGLTIINKIVVPLLEIEDSPQYWYESRAWPYPDAEYLQKLCGILDSYGAEWGLEVRTFWLAWNLQHIKNLVCQYLEPVYQERLKRQ